jgi:hypothetical protein
MSAFNSEVDDIEYFNCESCNNQTKCEDKINYLDENGPWFCPKCAYESDLRAPYSMDQCIILTMYAEKHKITFEEAIYYQTHCHCCGKTVDDGIFDEENHQYCKKKCFEYCEDYWYLCHQKADCKVCQIWQYHADREEKERRANVVVEAATRVTEGVAILENGVTVWYTIDDKKARYKGEWKNGLPNGKGIKHVYEGDYYIEGNFIDGFAEGYCKQTFEQTWEKTVPYYEGQFKRNEYHGNGEYHYGNGDYYKGEWQDSKYHGYGSEYSHRINKTWVGEFENDERVTGNWVKGEI